MIGASKRSISIQGALAAGSLSCLLLVARAASEDDKARREAVLATYKTGSITVAEMEDAIAGKSQRERQNVDAPGGRERFLRALVDYELLAQEALRRGYDKHYAVIDAARLRAVEAMMAKELPVEPAAVPAEDIAAGYGAMAAELGRPELRRAAHIMVATEAEARALMNELANKDRNYLARLAGRRSIDPRTQKQGGELGYFDREGKTQGGAPAGVPPELVAAAFALKKEGALAPKPIAHDGGFSVVMLTGIMPKLVPARERVEAKLRMKLAVERQARAKDAFAAKLRETYAPEVHPERIEPIVLAPVKPLDIPEGFPAAPPDPWAPAVAAPPEDDD